MTATLHLARTTSFPDTLRAYDVMLDGKLVGTLSRRQELSVPIAAGRHTLCVRLDWCGSCTSTFDARPGEELTFECASALTDWRPLFAFVYILFLRDDYLLLRRHDPRMSSAQRLHPPALPAAPSGPGAAAH